MGTDPSSSRAAVPRIVVRTARLPDLEGILERMVEFRGFLQQTTPPDPSMQDSLQYLLADPATEFIIGVDAGRRVVGYAQVRFRYSAWVSGWEAEIEDLFVTTSERGQGMGRRILDAVFAASRRRGCRSIGLTTNEGNRAARALYEGAGFRAERVRWGGLPQLWLQRLDD